MKEEFKLDRNCPSKKGSNVNTGNSNRKEEPKETFRQGVMRMVSAGKYQIVGSSSHGLCLLINPGAECLFLDFIIRTSRFGWNDNRKWLAPYYDGLGITHTLSKLCALGYLLSDVRDIANRKLIVAVNSNANVSGGTGKTLFVNAARMFYSKTCHWYDDMLKSRRENCLKPFDFVEISGDRPFKIDKYLPYLRNTENPAQLYFTTNQDMKKQLHKNSDTTITLFFSDYYNSTRTVIDDLKKSISFGENAPENERLSLQMLLSDCILLYREYGLIQAPEFYNTQSVNAD